MNEGGLRPFRGPAASRTLPDIIRLSRRPVNVVTWASFRQRSVCRHIFLLLRCLAHFQRAAARARHLEKQDAVRPWSGRFLTQRFSTFVGQCSGSDLSTPVSLRRIRRPGLTPLSRKGTNANARYTHLVPLDHPARPGCLSGSASVGRRSVVAPIPRAQSGRQVAGHGAARPVGLVKPTPTGHEVVSESEP